MRTTLMAILLAAVLAPAALTAEPLAPTDAQLNRAAKWCKAQRAANPAAFATTWGKNGNAKNAYGKCVSWKAKQLAAAAKLAREQAREAKAAKTCKAALKADAAAFAAKWGSGKNALGKCVSAGGAGGA